VEFETAVRTRRTHKAYEAEPVDEQTLRELVELARWAPNHRLTNPWRFRVVGPKALAELKLAANAIEAGSGDKLDRAPTLVAVTSAVSGDAQQDEEDLCATAVATYLVLLGAHDRGLGGYWRTPGVLRDAAGRRALGIGDDEHAVGLVYLGRPRQDQRVPDRDPVDAVLSWLD
jgi:nitroreductase